MSKSKPITDKGFIIFYDYEFIFNFLTDEELGILIRQMFKEKDNLKLNPTDNKNINNAYNYIVNRIKDYKLLQKSAKETGSLGGNPALTLKGTLNPTLNGSVNLKDIKIKDIKVKDIKELKEIVYSPEFEDVWKIYPASRRENKKECFKFFKQIPDARKDKVKELLTAYIASNGKEDCKYIKQSVRWFRDWETWIDNAPIQKMDSAEAYYAKYIDDIRQGKPVPRFERP